MRIITFAKRNFKEIVRDPVSLIFSCLLPLFLLFIFQQIKLPDDTYSLENFTPGIIIFGLPKDMNLLVTCVLPQYCPNIRAKVFIKN